MNVLCWPVDLLPQLHLNGNVQLDKSGLQMHRLTVRVVEVDSSLLALVTMDVTYMSSQVVTCRPPVKFVLTEV